MFKRTGVGQRALIGLIALTCGAASLYASFPIGQTVAAGGREAVVRLYDTGWANNDLNGAGTGNIFMISAPAASPDIKICMVTAHHVYNGFTPDHIAYRGRDQAGRFNATPYQWNIQQIGTADIDFIGIKIKKADLGANAAVLSGIAPLGLGASPNGVGFDIQEWGFGLSATPDTVASTAYPFVYHPGVNAEEYGILRTFANRITVNTGANAGGYAIRNLRWAVGGPAIANVGSGAPGDSGAGLIDLAGNANTIMGILVGGTDTRFTSGKIAWTNADTGSGIGFSQQVVDDLVNRCQLFTPAPGSLSLGLAGLTIFAPRRRRA